MKLENLLGKHVLTGCDTDGIIKTTGIYPHACVIDFVLDGVVVSAVEDPDDGYRSCLSELLTGRVESVKNTFPACFVTGIDHPDNRFSKNDVIDLVDDITGKVVLSIGTGNADDYYYPMFIGEFNPKSMTINAEIL